MVDHSRRNHERAFLIGEHVHGLYNVAHLAVLEPFSVFHLHHDVLPRSLLQIKLLFVTNLLSSCIFAVRWDISAMAPIHGILAAVFLAGMTTTDLFVDNLRRLVD